MKTLDEQALCHTEPTAIACVHEGKSRGLVRTSPGLLLELQDNLSPDLFATAAPEPALDPP
ncbi:MAG: hypothetical protein WBE50_14395, partial [Methyloceanibacter sp.]